MSQVYADAAFQDRTGFIFFMDGSVIAPLAADTDVEAADASGALTDITAAAVTSGSLVPEGAIVTSGALYVGHREPFANLRFTVGGGQPAQSGGSLTVAYFNGQDWAVLSAAAGEEGGHELEESVTLNGTALGQDGLVSFLPPRDWAKGGLSGLDADKYYLALWYGYPATPPRPDLLCPVFPQWYAPGFATSFRARTAGPAGATPSFVTDRGDATRGLVVVRGKDEAVLAPFPVSFSLRLEGVGQEWALMRALECGNPGTAAWAAQGQSTDGLKVRLARIRGREIMFPGLGDTADKSLALVYLQETEVDRKALVFPVCQAKPLDLAETDSAVELQVELVSHTQPVHAYWKHSLKLRPR